MPAVLRTLTTARDAWKNTPNAPDRLISAAQWAQLDDSNPNSLLSNLITQVNARDADLAMQAPLTGQLSQAGARATMFCSHFHQVLDLASGRGDLARGARTFYGRAIDATSIPKMSTYAEVTAVATQIASGETARQTAEGAAFVAMSNPSAAAVAAVFAPFTTLLGQSSQAQDTTNQQEEVVTGLYEAAHTLAVDICDTVEFNVRQDARASSRRAKARKWGVVYQNDDGTLATEETEAAAAAKPAGGNSPAPGAGGKAPAA